MNDGPRHSALSRVRQTVLENWPIENFKSTVVVAAVSGGPDSVAMLQVLHQLFQQKEMSGKLVVAHVNHATRGEQSEGDAEFVARLSDYLGLPYHLIGPGTIKTDEPPTSEAELRQMRYTHLIQLTRQLGARYLATGHNQEDQIETVLFRIFRGTGLRGLAGIPRFRSVDGRITIVRPLLSVRRLEILELLAELKQDYREDHTNSTSQYSRNFLRNEVIPKINERFESTFSSGILSLAGQAAETQQLLDALAAELSNAFEIGGRELVIHTDLLVERSPVLVRHRLVLAWNELGWPQQDMTTRHWNRLAQSILHPNQEADYHLPGRVSVRFEKKRIVLCRTGP